MQSDQGLHCLPFLLYLLEDCCILEPVWAASWQNQQNGMCAQRRLRSVCPVWSESSLCTLWVAKDPSVLHADSEDSDQTGRMPLLIWVFTGHTCHFVGFVMRQLICSNFRIVTAIIWIFRCPNMSSGMFWGSLSWSDWMWYCLHPMFAYYWCLICFRSPCVAKPLVLPDNWS